MRSDTLKLARSPCTFARRRRSLHVLRVGPFASGQGIWSGAELFAEGIVPIVRNLAHGLEEVLELFVVEARDPTNGAEVDFVFLRVDGERRIARREERELEQAAIESLAPHRNYRYHRGEEEKNAVVVQNVHPHARRAPPELGVTGLVEARQSDTLVLLDEAVDVGVDHGSPIAENLARYSVGVRRLAARGRCIGIGHLVLHVMDSTRASAPSSPKRIQAYAVRALGFALIVVGFFGCSAKTSAPDASAELVDVARAEIMLHGEVLPERAEVLSVAQGIEARAQREGAGARAVTWHVLAAGLFERLYRVDKRPEDAKEGVDALRLAAKDLATPGACDAAVRAARLAGDVAHDASVTYAELYRASRKAPGGDAGSAPSICLGTIQSALTDVDAFRPPAEVLEAIDQGLLGEGALANALADAGMASRVRVTPRVVRIEQWASEEGARVVVHLDKPARFRVGDEAKPGKGARTFVELDGVELAGGARDVKLGGIATMLHAEPSITGSRVLVDLSGPCYRKVFHLVEPFRVVIDIARNPPGTEARNARKVARVVLDPGHGGNDPGASGPTGIKEKDVTLDIAHKVAPVLAKQGLAVMLTRDDDRYVTLEERTARANAFAADLFVSIHCNAAENRTRRGIETYVLDTDASEMASRLAARENATSQAATAELGAILANMRLADQATRSKHFASLLQRAAFASLRDKYTDLVDGGVHVAGFYVLVGARMPGVLFETSYVSNPTEEQRLGSDDYRGRLADAIANAIAAYREGR